MAEHNFKEAWQYSQARSELLEEVLQETLDELTDLGLDSNLRERWRSAELKFNELPPIKDK